MKEYLAIIEMQQINLIIQKKISCRLCELRRRTSTNKPMDNAIAQNWW